MAKSKSKGVKVEKCECSKCGEKATAQANTPHAFCRGFRLLKPLPPMFAKLRQPVKGIWLAIEAPIPISAETAIEKFVS